MDEVSLSAETHVHHIAHGMLTQTTWSPKSFGLSHIHVDDLKVSGIRKRSNHQELLAGTHGPQRDIVLAHSAATLWIAGITHSHRWRRARAAKAIDSGTAASLVSRLAEISNSE